ncbi:MAG: NPXTG-anchored protein [Ruminococcus sp.]|uniref:NPXTG-anchored protein n=1 Tax=Ruminococcus sp. TaxID=41978 RepID=UPI001B09B08D|nr:NPXTG-anchored protein [Ruminococcus sp.]MBO7474305.1 NPXTG-anchored protein [Ruminococcus sp.]
MNKIISIISAAVCTASLAAATFSSSAAENEKVYGTMEIPYADFYKAEIESTYEVDAVSSATEKKWKMNGEGEYVEGTYNDGNGTILGVRYPVEVSSEDVAALSEKYGFTPLDSKPAAYKEVSLSGGALSVSKLVDTNGEQTVDGSATVSTNSYYGDYQIKVTGYPENTVLYGVIVNTKEDDHYAMRHLENIWRNGSYAWSAGIKTIEYHGNHVSYEDYESSKGKTVTSVTFITLDGYTTVNVGEQYLPIRFAGEVKAEDAAAGTGKTSLSITGFPEDYKKVITADEGLTATETEVSYTNAKPGAYNVNVEDESGKYAPMTAQFVLSTNDVPVKYADGKLTTADGFTDEDKANFLNNLSTVDINGTSYRATGKNGIKLFSEDDSVNFDTAVKEEKVFTSEGTYNITLNSTGYNNPYSFEAKNEAQNTTTTTVKVTTKAKTTTKTSNSPKTGAKSMALPVTVLAFAGAAAFVLRKKNDQ